jgi:DNA (cytosine-5)-methyltransferase 1
MVSNRVFEPGFTFVDLFAGIGGFHLALSEHGGRCVMACEIDDDCRKVYENYFIKRKGETFQFPKDIRTLTKKNGTDELLSSKEIDKIVPDHDILCGGFPCQPFSKGGAQQGIMDTTRGTLFQDIIQIIEAKQPKLVLLENVRNLLGPKHKDTWRTIVKSLNTLGYFVENSPLILSPHEFKEEDGGRPQFRERVFIIAYRLKDFHEQTSARVRILKLLSRIKDLKITGFSGMWSPSQWDIRTYLDQDTDGKMKEYLINDNEYHYLECWNNFIERLDGYLIPSVPIWSFALQQEPKISPETPAWERLIRERLSSFYNEHQETIDDWKSKKWGPDGMKVSDFPTSRQKFEWQADDIPGRKLRSKKEKRSLNGLIIQLRPSGIRVKLPSYVPTLVAINQTTILGSDLWPNSGGKYRRLTPWECSKLQGIPREVFLDELGSQLVDDTKIYKQLGNAVCSSLISFVFKNINNSIDLKKEYRVEELEIIKSKFGATSE